MLPEKSPQQIRYQGALNVALALKMFAVLIAAGGFLLAVAGGIEVSDADGNVAEFVGFVFGATAGSVLFFAFLGYALEVLVDIWENTWVSRAIAEADEDDEDDEAPAPKAPVLT